MVSAEKQNRLTLSATDAGEEEQVRMPGGIKYGAMLNLQNLLTICTRVVKTGIFILASLIHKRAQSNLSINTAGIALPQSREPF